MEARTEEDTVDMVEVTVDMVEVTVDTAVVDMAAWDTAAWDLAACTTITIIKKRNRLNDRLKKG
jgi:hypothetical protein